MATVILLEFGLEDRPGEVLPVLELIDRFHFNISYIQFAGKRRGVPAFQNGPAGGGWKAAVSRFMRRGFHAVPPCG